MSGGLGLDRIYVINVRAFEGRRRHVLAELARFGLECEFVHEFDAVDLTSEIDARHFPRVTKLTPAQKSCALKHVTALRRIAARGEQASLVLEDDVVLSKDFADGIMAALAEWSTHSRPSVIFIGSGGNFYTPRTQRRPGQRLYVGRRGRFADSYILGCDEAKLRLERIDRSGIDEPIDNQFETMDRAAGITMLWLEEPVVEQGSKNGLFVTALQPAHPNFVQRLLFGWEKFRRKYLYQLWR